MKATIFIPTAALIAGTACAVWAGSNKSGTLSHSFERMERSIYDSNINYNPSSPMANEIRTLYSNVNIDYSKSNAIMLDFHRK